jgi:hypothetical protein
VRENPDGVNARKIFTSKCAEYSPTNETIGATLLLSPSGVYLIAVARMSEVISRVKVRRR